MESKEEEEQEEFPTKQVNLKLCLSALLKGQLHHL